MSEFSGKPNQDDEAEVAIVAFLVFVAGPVGLAGFMGWPWWSCLVGMAAVATAALVGWKVWGWVQLRRAKTPVIHLITRLDALTQPRTQITQEYAPASQDLDALASIWKRH